MLLGIAFVSIQTAMITSVFIDARQSARREGQAGTDEVRWAKLDARLDDHLGASTGWRPDRPRSPTPDHDDGTRTAAGR